MSLRPTRILLFTLFRLVALRFNRSARLRHYLRWVDGWLDSTVAFRTEDWSVAAGLSFKEGRVRAIWQIPAEVDATLVFEDTRDLREMLISSPSEVLNLLLKNRVRVEGNFAHASLFNFLFSQLLGGVGGKQAAESAVKQLSTRLPGPIQRRVDVLLGIDSSDTVGAATSGGQETKRKRRQTRLAAPSIDLGVKYLSDPYLSGYSLGDFPRLARMLDEHFTIKPELSAERPLLLTDWFREHGFERDKHGRRWVPELRQARAFEYLMSGRAPIIRDGDLVGGTTTDRRAGVIVYPDGHGTTIWGELDTLPDRELNPYDVPSEVREQLHTRVFPFWMHRNFQEWVRERYDSPLGQQLDERFAVYFVWKKVGLSHTIPDYPKLLRLGTRGLRAEIGKALEGASEEQRHPLEAMAIALSGVEAYARNLAREAARLAEIKTDVESEVERRHELLSLARTVSRVPEHPAQTLDEAVNSIWVVWVALHMENTNTGLSLGRLDQWLQPYFEADIEPLAPGAERDAYISHAIELIGCLFMACSDHLPLVPDVGNYLFGGATSDQAITLGGVTAEGEDGVNDMTYVLLKVTEMLAIRDPNINARYYPGKNSESYLRRLCEVNLITTATPSMHNDVAVCNGLKSLGYPLEAINDWSATGCVEPTLSGQHMGHTGSILLNMVAALEMALNDGLHPLMDWQVGPRTGRFELGELSGFEKFFCAYERQLTFLIEQSVSYNNMLAEAHAELRPSPLLSALVDGCIESGRDATRGGARYNTSGVACIGLADVTDSLLAIEQLVYSSKDVSPAELMEAIRVDFVGHSGLQARLQNRCPRFGSGNAAATAMANRLARLAQDLCGAKTNYRGGRYVAGFWSMSNHVAFGTLAGALPSGRRAGSAFTPGLTPQPNSNGNLLDNLRDVAQLDPTALLNNIAFNVKIVPGGDDTHERVVDTMRAYVDAYFELGGMQMQMNAVTSATLRDAMSNPEAYRDLLVRISGYNAYFVTLNRDMQRELIERSEYGLT